MDTNKPKFTGDLFYKFFQCPHWIWYDIYGDAQHKKDTPPILELIYRGKLANSDEIIRNHKKFDELSQEAYKDLDEAFMATLEMMKKGENIFRGVLMHEHWVGMPDLLEARPGKSDLGDWQYVVYDIQNSLDLRDDYKFQLIFYSLILEKLQGVRPKEAYVIDSNGNERSFVIDEFLEEFHLTMGQIDRILNGEKPAPFLKSGCKRTPWYSLCLSETEGCNDVSLIFRISQADQRRLYNIGIKTISDLAIADADDLQSKLEDWPFDKIVRFLNQAKCLESGEPMILRKNEFPAVANEIYFDIESDPTRDIDYLLGVLIKNGDKQEYKAFLANDKNDEAKNWERFLDFLGGLEDFVIYHYAWYERHVFERLALKYGAPTSLMEKFRNNTIDLHAALVESAVLPLYFYTLKDAASYIGFKWNDPQAGGAESVLWYNDWLDKKDPAIMNRILKYNEDDVRATLLVKEWLAGQKPSKKKERLDE